MGAGDRKGVGLAPGRGAGHRLDMEEFAGIGARLRGMRGGHWLALFGLLALAWLVLFAAQPGTGLWAALCAPGAAAGLPGLWAMWALMGAAMMLPTAVPALATFDDLTRGAPGPFWRLVAGITVIWAGFAVLAALAQAGLARAGLLGPAGGSASILLSSVLLIGAGAYQFTPLKLACLSKCRAPLAFFMSRWDAGPWRMGLALGATCLGCCAALMALAFVGGAMNLAFMTGAMALMFLEKLPELGAPVTRPLGLGLIAAGLALPLLT